jgi:hypothetical protein
VASGADGGSRTDPVDGDFAPRIGRWRQSAVWVFRVKLPSHVTATSLPLPARDTGRGPLRIRLGTSRRCEILFGEVGQVVKGVRQSITKRRLTGPKRKTLNAVANYLYRNRTRMRYHEYLAQGWPIASGPVEGACKNLIKDHMERSGMRWTEQMAEAIVKLRAVYLSGDFDRYWQFHIDQDQRRLYPVAWAVVPK